MKRNVLAAFSPFDERSKIFFPNEIEDLSRKINLRQEAVTLEESQIALEVTE
jgi:hypothetical protein